MTFVLKMLYQISQKQDEDERILLRFSVMLPDPNVSSVYAYDKKTVLCLSGKLKHVYSLTKRNRPGKKVHKFWKTCQTCVGKKLFFAATLVPVQLSFSPSVSSVETGVDRVEFQAPGDRILGAGVSNHEALFFTNNRGFVCLKNRKARQETAVDRTMSESMLDQTSMQEVCIVRSSEYLPFLLVENLLLWWHVQILPLCDARWIPFDTPHFQTITPVYRSTDSSKMAGTKQTMQNRLLPVLEGLVLDMIEGKAFDNFGVEH